MKVNNQVFTQILIAYSILLSGIVLALLMNPFLYRRTVTSVNTSAATPTPTSQIPSSFPTAQP